MRFLIRRKNVEDTLAQLETGLSRLSFEDNFQGFEWSGTIPQGSEVAIPNLSPGRKVPRGYLILLAEGTNAIVKGSTIDWTVNHVSLENIDASNDATLTVFFFL